MFSTGSPLTRATCDGPEQSSRARRNQCDEGWIVAERLEVRTVVYLQPAAVSLAERFPQEHQGAITLAEESCDGRTPIRVPAVELGTLPPVQPF